MANTQTAAAAAGTSITILIVEDHFVARFGLRGLLDEQKDMRVVAEARNGAEAVDLYAEHHPGIVLMDLRMPAVDGIAATTAIRRADGEALILMVSSYDTEAEVARAIKAGARGYIMKEAEPAELLRAIRAVAAGETYLPPSLEALLASADEQAILTPTEMRLLALIAEGLENKEIAQRVGLTAGTVRIYVSNLLAKLEVASRAEAVAVALRRGLLRGRR